LVRPVIGVRLAPRSLRTGPALRACVRTPWDPGLPFRHRCSNSYDGRVPAFTGGISNKAHASKNKKPSGALAREGPCETDFRYRLGEIAPMSRACAVDRSNAVQQFAEVFKTALHCSSHVVFASGMPAKRAVFTSARCRCQARVVF
jgi:hypothetical protein